MTPGDRASARRERLAWIAARARERRKDPAHKAGDERHTECGAEHAPVHA